MKFWGFLPGEIGDNIPKIRLALQRNTNGTNITTTVLITGEARETNRAKTLLNGCTVVLLCQIVNYKK